jgi:hypothetical protein
MSSRTAIKMNTTEAAAVTICPFCREERSVFHALRYEYEIDETTYKISMPHLLEHVFTTTCFETHAKRMGGKIEPTYEKAIEDMMKHMAKMDQRKDNFIKHFGEEESKKPSKAILRIIKTVWSEESEDAAPSVAMDILAAMISGEPTEEITDNYGDLWEHLTAIKAVGWYARGSIISKAKAVRTQRARKEKQDEPATSSDDVAAPARRDLIVELLEGKDEARDAEIAALKTKVATLEKMMAQILAEKAPAAVDLPEPTTPRADIPDEEEAEPERFIIIKKKKTGKKN